MSLASFLRVSGKRLLWGCAVSIAPLTASSAFAAGPTAEQALALVPVQKDIDYDKPTADEVAKCTIEVEKNGAISGWHVKDPTGQTLRRFLDTNGDNTVDQWSYFADGLEIYRDLDTNANGKADQFRWLNTAGSRWGLDANEDGKIDSWKTISAEEVSSEAVQAMAGRDTSRFQRLLLTTDELKALGLGEKYTTLIGDKLATASQRFTGLFSDSKFATVATSSTKWLNFSGTKPGMVPAGTDGTTKDLLVYENVAAMMELGGKSGQVQIGTMIRVGDVWRLVDVPMPVPEGNAQVAINNLFFNAPTPAGAMLPGPGPNAPKGGIFDALQEIEGKLAKATDAKELGQLKKERADLIEQALPSLKEEVDRTLWTKQFIDALIEGVQTNTYPDGLARLKEFEKKLALGNDKDLMSYARFSAMTAEYMLAQNNPQGNDNFVKVQAKWLDDLRAFVTAFPESSEASEALLHLAIDAEFAGNKEAEAKKLYAEIVTKFPEATAAKKAAGAVRRLDSIGKQLTLSSTTVDGKKFDLKMYAGKPTVLFYFAINGVTTAGDVATLKQVQAKYARDINVVGISLDSAHADIAAFLQQNRLPWVTLYEVGGIDGKLADDMGILTIPTLMLVDSSGKVVNRGLHITELDRELATLIKR